MAARLIALSDRRGLEDQRIWSAGKPWSILRIRPDPDIAVTIETTVAAERVTLLARACALSTGERELLGHLAGGADTHQIAKRMFLSDNTVQDHLKSIFAMSGTRNRRVLLARAASQ